MPPHLRPRRATAIFWGLALVLTGLTFCSTHPAVRAQLDNRQPGVFPVEYRDVAGARCYYWPGNAASLSCLPLKDVQ